MHKQDYDVKQLKMKAKTIYPKSKAMQESWVAQTVNLYASGKHAFQTGGWKRIEYAAR